MTGDFWYYDKLDFDLKSPMHMFRLPLRYLSCKLGLGELGGGGWGGVVFGGGGRCVGRQLTRPQGPVISCHLRRCGSFAGDTTFRRRKRREKTLLVPPSYLSRAHSKAEDSGFPSKNFPDSKSGLPFIHGAIKTYILNVSVGSGSL